VRISLLGEDKIQKIQGGGGEKDWVKEPYDYRRENVNITVEGQMQCRV
jgi:hypothetical protein